MSHFNLLFFLHLYLMQIKASIRNDLKQWPLINCDLTPIYLECMKKKVALPLLLATVIGITASHIRIKPFDASYLLEIDGRDVDVVGFVQDKWTNSTRNCQSSELDKSSNVYRSSELAIKNFSPPSSSNARILGFWFQNDWALVELEFDELQPAVVPVKFENGVPIIVTQGIWSGLTKPWKAAPFIRNYMASKLPDMPESLLDCYEPRAQYFK